ncbi:MAG: TolC family protein, partial [Bacteroidetes bacterium]|nr:TolC family protein [Bacteroidota bacterium]
MIFSERPFRLACFASFWILTGFDPAYAQSTILSLKDVIRKVETNLPRLDAARRQSEAAAAGISLVKNSMVPDLTAGYQAGYATFNNISGMSYPGLIMPISGPPSTANAYDLVPGTALAALVKWEPLTFGRRNAAIQKATAQFRLANAAYNQELFRQQYAAIATYLDAVYLHRLLTGLQANYDRVAATLTQSLELARQGLKPGVDTVQFQSQLAQARTAYLSTQKAYEAQLIELTRLAGISSSIENIVLSDTSVAAGNPVLADTARQGRSNPVLEYYQSREQASKAALKEISSGWRPRLDIWG